MANENRVFIVDIFKHLLFRRFSASKVVQINAMYCEFLWYEYLMQGIIPIMGQNVTESAHEAEHNHATE